MDIHDDVSTTPRKAKTSKQLSGSVLDVLRELLTGRRDDEIIELFAKLVARNKELELLLGKMRESKNRGEQISAAQLDLFLDKLREESDGELDEADAKLEKVATLNAGRVEPTKPPKQPPVRRPPPPGLRRVRNC
jgi:hypothetical protein